MPDKKNALVTGANQGIGLQIAKELAKAGFTVLLGARDLEKGKTAAAQVGGDATAIQLDVTDEVSVRAAAKQIGERFGCLDVLVNNAGISHAKTPGRPLAEIARSGRASGADLDEVRAVFDTNVFGAMAVTQAMLPLLKKAPAARIVNVSSITGSLTWSSNPDNPYGQMFGLYAMSKAAMNALTVAFALDLRGTNIKVNAACPGFTKTNLNNYQGTGSVEDAAKVPVQLALLGPDGPTGTFSNSDGPLPW